MTRVKLKEQYISYLSLLQTLNNISVIMLLRTFNIISPILEVRRGDYVIQTQPIVTAIALPVLSYRRANNIHVKPMGLNSSHFLWDLNKIK